MIFDKIFPPATIHMIGIGGISMSGLAEILKNKGYIVKGSDMTESSVTERLQESGITVTIGHDAKNIGNADAVIFTAAVKKDNPEYQEAEKRNIPLIERSELLGEITKMYAETIAIAGTHGKTTTTSMLASAFLEAGKDPTITVGGELNKIHGNYKIGNDNFLITEACEYVESFLKFFPKTAIVLNVDEDHLDYYKDINHIKSSFQKFLDKLPKDGLAILNADDENSKDLIQNTKAKVLTFGIDNTANYTAKNIVFTANEVKYDFCKNGTFRDTITLHVFGKHNIYDSLSCLAVCDAYGLNLSSVKNALAEFSGAKRRFEKKGNLNGAMIYDDYAHHPAEIKATLSAAKAKTTKKVICVFQPHTYTRTKALLNEFSQAFYDADQVIVTDIYAAREKDTGLVNSKDLTDKINSVSQNAIYMKDFSDIEYYLKETLSEGDLFLTIGAGNVYKIGENLIND